MITVNDAAPTSLVYSLGTGTYTKGVAIPSNTPSNSGGVVTSYSVSPGLPTGLSLNSITGVITGTPTVIIGSTSYTVTASNTGGTITVDLQITVNDVAPSVLTYTLTTATYTKGVSIPVNSPSNTGGSVTSYSVSPALPSGLNLNTINGVISGTPTIENVSRSYAVTASNSGGSCLVNLNITVNALPIVLIQPISQSISVGQSVILSISATGTSPLSYQWVKDGVNIGFNLPTHTIASAQISDSGSYYVIVSNVAGNATSASANLTVVQSATTLVYSNPTSGSYQFIKNISSTGTHLVLDLVGPAVLGSGIAISLSSDVSKVTWVDVPPGGSALILLSNGTQFNLGSGVPIMKARATGNVLQATIAQKAPAAPVPLNGVLLSIALDFKPGLGLASGTLVPFSVDQTKCLVMDGSGNISAIAIAVGTLVAQ